MSKNRLGLIVGSFLALWHLLWSVLVVTGAAQFLLNWVFKLHFLNNPFTVGQFSIQLAALLIVATFVVGYIFGWVLALLWNSMHKRAH